MPTHNVGAARNSVIVRPMWLRTLSDESPARREGLASSEDLKLPRRGGSLRLALHVPTQSRDYDAVSASTWIRALQMVRHYRALNVRVDVNPRRMHHDVAIVFREPSERNVEVCRTLARTCGRVYFDTVVNYFVPHAASSLAQVEAQQKIADLCSGLICSSSIIAEEASSHAARVHVMPDPIDVEHFRPSGRPLNLASPMLGWSGYSSKAHALEPYARHISGHVSLITDQGVVNEALPFEFSFVPWTWAGFPEAVDATDIGFVPRRWYGDPYNSGHSVFKPLVFAAMGKPIIASAVPSYVELKTYYEAIVFLEECDDSVEAAVRTLRKIGPLDTGAVRREYSCETQAIRMIQFLTED